MLWHRGEELAKQLLALGLTGEKDLVETRKDILKSLQGLCNREKDGPEAPLKDRPEWAPVSLAIRRYCETALATRSKSAPPRRLGNLLVKFLEDWNKFAGLRSRKDQPLTNKCTALVKQMVDQVRFKLLYLQQKPKIRGKTPWEIIYQIALRCEHRLAHMGDLQHKECKDDSADVLRLEMRTRKLALKAESQNNVGKLRRASVEPSRGVDFPNVHLELTSEAEHSHIVCTVDPASESIQYSVPIDLTHQMFAVGRDVVLVPSKTRSSPLAPDTYPQLFLDEWQEVQPDSPTVIIVVDEGEAEKYVEYLRDVLWSPHEPKKQVVMMRVEGPDQWTLNVGRKRQVMKLLMETLKRQNHISNERYVTHDDDIRSLETLNKIGGSIQITVPDAIMFLHKIMDDGKHGQEPQPVRVALPEKNPDGTPKSITVSWAMFLFQALGSMLSSNQDMPLGTAIFDSTVRLSVWQGTSDAPTWNEVEEKIKLSVSRSNDPQLDYLWNRFKAARNPVAMVAVMNKEHKYKGKQCSSMFLGRYTHCNSEQMYSFVLHQISSLEGAQFMNPEHFFAMPCNVDHPRHSIWREMEHGMRVHLPAIEQGRTKVAYDKEWAANFGYKHEDRRFAQRAQKDLNRLTFGTPLIMMSRQQGLCSAVCPSKPSRTHVLTPKKGNNSSPDKRLSRPLKKKSNEPPPKRRKG